MVKIACYFAVVRGMGPGPHFLEGPSQEEARARLLREDLKI